MDLLALADFNLVARHGSFGEAARAAERPKATLSRRVSELENGLRIRLFERGPRGVRLTQEGHALYERTGALLAELSASAAAIASDSEQPRGRLRISAPALFSQIAMGKLVASFALKWPQIRMEVTTEDRPVNIIEEGYDLVIRVNPAPDESLIGRIFLRDRLVVVAKPGLQRPAGRTPVAAVIRGASDQASFWDVAGPRGKTRIFVNPVARLSSLLMVRDTVRLGVGAACLPLSLVSRDISSGTLEQWGEVDGPEIALWALYPSRRYLSARVSAFLDHLKTAFPSGVSEELAAFIGT